LARQVGHVPAIAVSLFNQARLLARDDEQARTALACAEEALEIAERYDLTSLAEDIKPLVMLLRERTPKRG